MSVELSYKYHNCRSSKSQCLRLSGIGDKGQGRPSRGRGTRDKGRNDADKTVLAVK